MTAAAGAKSLVTVSFRVLLWPGRHSPAKFFALGVDSAEGVGHFVRLFLVFVLWIGTRCCKVWVRYSHVLYDITMQYGF